MDSAVVDALQRGQWRSGDLLCSLYHSLQSSAVQSRGAAVPDGDTAGQDALNNAAVEVSEDLRRHAKLPQLPQEVQPRPITEVSSANFRMVLSMWEATQS